MPTTAHTICLNRLETRRWLDELEFRHSLKLRAARLVREGTERVKILGHRGVLAGGTPLLYSITDRDLRKRRARQRLKLGYPRNWPEIRLKILNRARYRCENCGACQGEEHPVTGKLVRLQISHQNHVKSDCRDENLKALCPSCHGQFDGAHRSREYWRKHNNWLSR
ncbi:MAG: hypothetical protein WCB68_07020 [Pyrinomonadaceae bacterium]